jgi:hypothetical protein
MELGAFTKGINRGVYDVTLSINNKVLSVG